jgi:hypothetical protein
MSYPPGPPSGEQPENQPGEQPGDRPGEPPSAPGWGQQPPDYGAQQGYGQPAGYGQAPPPYGAPQPPAGFPPPTNGKATASLIVGITTLVLSWCCGAGVFGLIAIVLGVKGRSEIRRSGGAQSGEGIAMAGIVTGAIAILLGILVVVLIVVVIASGNAAFEDYNTGTSL